MCGASRTFMSLVYWAACFSRGEAGGISHSHSSGRAHWLSRCGFLQRCPASSGPTQVPSFPFHPRLGSRSCPACMRVRLGLRPHREVGGGEGGPSGLGGPPLQPQPLSSLCSQLPLSVHPSNPPTPWRPSARAAATRHVCSEPPKCGCGCSHLGRAVV